MIPANARNASLTSPEVGNAAATSGSSTTTALPATYRDAYLLREAALKSYSGRISSASTVLPVSVLLRGLFIIPSLIVGGESRADDANYLAPVNIHDSKQSLAFRKAQQHEPLFVRRMTRI